MLMRMKHEEVFPAMTSSIMQGLKSLGIFKPGIIIKISEEAGKNLARILMNENEGEVTFEILHQILGIPRDAIKIEESGNTIKIMVEKERCTIRKYMSPHCDACPVPGFIKGFLNAKEGKKWRIGVKMCNGKVKVREEDNKYCYFTLVSNS